MIARQIAAKAVENAPTAANDTGSGDWYSKASTNKNGSIIDNLANAALAVREDPSLTGVFVYDEMARATLITRAVLRYNGKPAVSGPFPRPATDNDITAVQEGLQLSGLTRVRKDTIHQAVDMVASENAFHPARDYLQGLKWDGVVRLPTWMQTYLGASPTKYVAGIGKMFFVAMVARIFSPGCKADYMVILEGLQGIMKSTVCAILGGEWFSDNLPENVAGKDAAQHLRGKWLIEIAEMHAMSKADVAALKAFITRPIEIFRPPYGRKDVHEPRQCLFIGTTNKEVYLRDETGGRRFWPVKVGVTHGLDPDALRRDRDQLFAEAVHRFKEREKWWPDKDFEVKHIKPEQEARYDADVWEDVIRDAIKLEKKITVTKVATHILLIENGRISRGDQNRITAILERLGWVRRRSGGVRYWICDPSIPANDSEKVDLGGKVDSEHY